MSLDYYVWEGPQLSAAAFGQRLFDLDEHGLDEASIFERSDRLPRFRREVLSRYPALEDLGDDPGDSPWAMTPVESTRFIELNFRWGATKEQLTFVLERALFHGLSVYDPQNERVVMPGPARWQIWLRRLGLGPPDR